MQAFPDRSFPLNTWPLYTWPGIYILVVDTPDCRIYVVEAEGRVYTVAVELRTLAVESESRSLVVEALTYTSTLAVYGLTYYGGVLYGYIPTPVQRTFEIPAEDRTLVIKKCGDGGKK